MTRNVLLDTNLLVAAFDRHGTASEDIKNAAMTKLTTLLSDPETKLFITPLIRYEVLRGIKWPDSDSYSSMCRVLNDFPELEITRNVAELSANLFRFDTHEMALQGTVTKNIEKRKFDVFHYCCASCNDLYLESNDTDIAKIEQLYQSYLGAI
ncbi:PIN domain-containing protein [Providencia heimbachae]|uniref:PIN domain-containing protein n=1 Tax=Providencia heimbachae ATCC 35613 TaxID=1354272 RepID=A0A1B7K2L3_9GAMM|nr:hypothetical protein [Providencia heimbachae]OAT54254.1 hypothetical protein M998_0586 [Providencia heimbachae ATCC 35613]SQH13644.1 Uncharacterised protein [Providencia heimbachae]